MIIIALPRCHPAMFFTGFTFVQKWLTRKISRFPLAQGHVRNRLVAKSTEEEEEEAGCEDD